MLPATAQIHPVFHVSRLKPFQANYVPVFSELPAAPDLQISAPTPMEIVEHRMVRKDNSAIPQILVRWAHMPENHTTWEDYYVLKTRYPDASLWEVEVSRGGETVTPSSPRMDIQSPG
uniref:Uncharacterized protein n=1 Tax=Avena sativa TaxID=4498 RepID=A0ACD5Y888_AVESA